MLPRQQVRSHACQGALTVLLTSARVSDLPAIEAIREAHRLELEREEQRREAGSTHLGDLHRLHR